MLQGKIRGFPCVGTGHLNIFSVDLPLHCDIVAKTIPRGVVVVVVFACVEVTASVVVVVVVFTTIDKERLWVYVFYHKNTTQKSQFCRHPKHLCLFFFFIMIYLRIHTR